ncbi:putative rrna-processing protein efg1 [Diaporthe ampelina]|uniref:rRNA-processing protein EFG1 n=1 Tax=Diaporthe ampelina TaxID=1214573 RepID=A0A0G2FPN5_9PEZI|nr:putative rrna-processing protein efg1 [Diaporthe ampelina]
MGSKRPHSDVDGASSRHNAPNKRTKQHFQSHKPATPGNSTQLGVSLHEVKRRARNIERRFAKGDDLPADVKQKLERELVKCKAQIDEISHKKRRHDMISKYHRVRFFERKKAERLRKKLKKQADEATDPEEKANIEADLHVADVDYHYTRYFPFLERYESLYTATENSKDDEAEGQPAALRALHSERPPMWKVVEEAMRNGQAALEELQERRPEKSQERPPEKQKSKTVREKPVRPSKPSPVVKPVPTTPKEEEPKKRPEAVPKMEGNRRMRRAKGIFNEKGPAGSDENGESFFDS